MDETPWSGKTPRSGDAQGWVFLTWNMPYIITLEKYILSEKGRVDRFL